MISQSADGRGAGQIAIFVVVTVTMIQALCVTDSVTCLSIAAIAFEWRFANSKAVSSRRRMASLWAAMICSALPPGMPLGGTE